MRTHHSNKNPKDTYYIYGKHATLAALQNPHRYIHKIYCLKEVYQQYENIIKNHRFELVTTDFFKKILEENPNHQGIAAKVETIFSHDLSALNLNKPNIKLAVLDQITDPQNIGSIIRSAAAFGIEGIIMPKDNCPSESGTIAKAASGTLELVHIFKVTNLKSAMEYLKKHGFWVIGFDGKAKEFLNKKALSGKVALILGAEGKGMRRLSLETCDILLRIPISSKVESLNVANAASIIFYEASRASE